MKDLGPPRLTELVRWIASVCLVATAVIASGCERPTGDPPPPAPDRASLILVFCDITTSVDGASITKVKEKARELLEGMPPGSRLVAYPIDDNDYAEPIGKYESPNCPLSPKLTEEMAKTEQRACLESKRQSKTKERDELINAIQLKYDELKSGNPNSHRSCIIDTLAKIEKFFKAEDPRGYQFEVVYLSDMIEQCKSKAGSIYLCSSTQTPNNEEITKKIDEQYKPDFNLKKLVANNISVVITTKMLGDNNNKCLYKEEHETIWRRVFMKVGYDDADFKSFSFDTELPARFRAKAAS